MNAIITNQFKSKNHVRRYLNSTKFIFLNFGLYLPYLSTRNKERLVQSTDASIFNRNSYSFKS